ncbi:putative loganate O-methyltransferase [Lupinus albus]|uniref:Putative loganate O-methyltransferase n=1 Tax=Lupinus albus TaxID=3870 RepID=A0A6A4PV09_LUPAL|nr:putative loganate O-methyltransferase [Lupinus albus]
MKGMGESLRDHHSLQISKEDKLKVAINALPPNGGNGTYSYTKNSYFQRISSKVVKSNIEEEIYKKLDVKKLASTSNTIRIVDLGCATGPNTFMTIQNLLEAMKHKYQTQCSNTPTKIPEFHVFFNDQLSNDFNTLFTTLPQDIQYFAAGVPGSFHGRLFPESSLHFAYTSYAIHFLSKSPQELEEKNSPTWNKGRVHYTSASKEVVDAYAAQFANDVRDFLDARAKELVPGGMLVMVMQGIPNGMHHSDTVNGMMYDYMGSILMEIAKEGMFDESKVDSFNLPYYGPNPEEMKKLVETNGRFSIERMELTNPAPWLKSIRQIIPEWTFHVRASMEGTFTRQFGNEVTHEMFQRLIKQLTQNIELLETKLWDMTQLFVVLKRKE